MASSPTNLFLHTGRFLLNLPISPFLAIITMNIIEFTTRITTAPMVTEAVEHVDAHTPNTQIKPWHRHTHELTRRRLLLRLVELHPTLRGLHESLPTTSSINDSTSVVNAYAVVPPTLLQHLEWHLYCAADSFEEYSNMDTLERRLQALGAQLERRFARVSCSRNKRLNADSTTPVQWSHSKRHRGCSAVKISVCVTSVSTTSSSFILNDDLNLLGHVFSFLTGRETLKCQAVNRFLALNASQMVKSLHLDAIHYASQKLQRSEYIKTLLMKCTNLKNLTITNSRRAPNTGITTRFGAHSFLCSAIRANLSKERSGANLLDDIAAAFEQGACLKLQTLVLRAPFTCSAESIVLVRFLQAFMTPRDKFSLTKTAPASYRALKDLVLDSTYMDDELLPQVTQLFERAARQHNPCFRELETLVICDNFVGQAGGRALMQSLSYLPALQTLDLSRNIITDVDAATLAEAFCLGNRVSSSSDPTITQRCRADKQEYTCMPTIQKLLLQGNYIGQNGFQAFVRAMCANLR